MPKSHYSLLAGVMILIGLVAASSYAYADLPNVETADLAQSDRAILYGSEWNFFTREMYSRGQSDHGVIDYYRQRLLTKITTLCNESQKCSVEPKSGRVTYRNGYWFQVETDIGTIEVVAKPTTLKEFKDLQEDLQNDLFISAQLVGLYDKTFGHIHFGVKTAFGDNAHEFRNFLVDWSNHPELGSHVLGFSNFNAAPIAILPLRQRLQFAKVIKEFDAGKIAGVYDLAKNIQDRVYSDDIDHSKRPYKYQELNLSTIVANPNDPSKWTVEVRSLAMQRSAAEHTLYLKILQRRIEYLSARKENIPILNQPIPENMVEAKKRFFRFVKESGLDWDQYKYLARRNDIAGIPDRGNEFNIEQLGFTSDLKPKTLLCIRDLISNHAIRSGLRPKE